MFLPRSSIGTFTGEADEARAAVVLGFARAVIANRGIVQDDDVAALRKAGVTKAEFVEILAHIGLNLFTNYFNQVVQTEVDFPAVRTQDARISA